MKIHELLTDETKWTKGVSALDSEGRQVYPQSKSAVCWCLVGAVHHCYKKSRDVKRKVANKIGCRSAFGVQVWNDREERTFADVRKLVLELDI